MNADASFDCSFDEQHSRPQRFTYGHAPYATCTLMNQQQLVFHMAHVDEDVMKKSIFVTKAGTACKSKAKVAHMQAFDWLKTNLDSELRHLCADQSETGHADAEAMLRTKWPNFTMSFDLWHKVYPFTAAWKKFINTRFGKRGAFKYPWLRARNDSGDVTANKLKSWWINCSETCGGDAITFLTMWLSAAEQWLDKYWEAEEESASEDAPVWKIGDELEAMYDDAEYYYGKIVGKPDADLYEFQYDDGTPNQTMEGRFIRKRTPIEGPPIPLYEPSESSDGDEDSDSDADSNAGDDDDPPENEDEDDMAVETPAFSRQYYWEAIYEFLEKQSKNYEYFLHGKVTSETESFHNLVGKYYRKGASVEFKQYALMLFILIYCRISLLISVLISVLNFRYIMKKTFAGEDWNEQKLYEEKKCPQRWQLAYLDEFISLLTKIPLKEAKSNAIVANQPNEVIDSPTRYATRSQTEKVSAAEILSAIEDTVVVTPKRKRVVKQQNRIGGRFSTGFSSKTTNNNSNNTNNNVNK